MNQKSNYTVLYLWKDQIRAERKIKNRFTQFLKKIGLMLLFTCGYLYLLHSLG